MNGQYIVRFFVSCSALPSGGGKGLKVRNIKDKLKLMFELPVQETPDTNWTESFPLKSTKNFQGQIWMENSKDFHLCVLERSSHWQLEKKLQILGSKQKKKRVQLRGWGWVDLKALRGKSNGLGTYNRTHLWKWWRGKWSVLVRASKYVYLHLGSVSTFSGWNNAWKYLKHIACASGCSLSLNFKRVMDDVLWGLQRAKSW